jgi:hypothetical protein
MRRYLGLQAQYQLQQGICYTKNLIASIASDYPDHKVHIRRFLPILQRVIPCLTQELDFFLQSEAAEEIPLKFVRMLSDCGEIVHLGEGYYFVPPVRCILLPASGEAIIISSLHEKARNVFGLIGLSSDKVSPSIAAEDWAYAEEPEAILLRYEKELREEPEFRPDRWLQATPRGLRQVKRPLVAKPNTSYLLTHRPFRHSEKEDWYIGRKTSVGWSIAGIDNANRRRVIIGLELRHGAKPNFSWSPYDDQYQELRLSRRIPIEERNMLALIGVPEKWQNPTGYLIPHLYRDDAKAILKRLKFEEVN